MAQDFNPQQSQDARMARIYRAMSGAPETADEKARRKAREEAQAGQRGEQLLEEIGAGAITEDPFLRPLQRAKRRATPLGAAEAAFTTQTGRAKGFLDYVPIADMIMEGRDTTKLDDALDAMARNKATREQELFVEEWYDRSQRPKTEWADTGAMLSTAVPFALEAVATGGLATLGKHAVRRTALRRAVRGAAARKAVLTESAGEAVATATKEAQSRLWGHALAAGRRVRVSANRAAGRRGRAAISAIGGGAVGAVQTGARTTVLGEGMRLPFGATRTEAKARALILHHKYDIDIDESHDLAIGYAETVPAFYKALIAGGVDVWLEWVTEGAGETLFKNMPLFGKIDALGSWLLEKSVTKKGAAAVTRAMRAGKLSGVLTETMEEELGMLLREGAAAEGVAPELIQEEWSNAWMPELEDHFRMMAGLGAFGLGFGAAGGLAGGAVGTFDRVTGLRARRADRSARELLDYMAGAHKLGSVRRPDMPLPESAEGLEDVGDPVLQSELKELLEQRAAGTLEDPADVQRLDSLWEEYQSQLPVEGAADAPVRPAAPANVEELRDMLLRGDLSLIDEAEARELGEEGLSDEDAQSVREKYAKQRQEVQERVAQLELVDPADLEADQRAVAEEAKRHGHTVVFASGGLGAQERAISIGGTGVIVLSAELRDAEGNRPEGLSAYFLHESVHATLRDLAPEQFAKFFQWMRTNAPREWLRFTNEYSRRQRETGAPPLDPENLGEEGVALLAQHVLPFIDELRRNPEAFDQLAAGDSGIVATVQRIIDKLIELAQKAGVSFFSTSQQKELRRIWDEGGVTETLSDQQLEERAEAARAIFALVEGRDPYEARGAERTAPTVGAAAPTAEPAEPAAEAAAPTAERATTAEEPYVRGDVHPADPATGETARKRARRQERDARKIAAREEKRQRDIEAAYVAGDTVLVRDREGIPDQLRGQEVEVYDATGPVYGQRLRVRYETRNPESGAIIVHEHTLPEADVVKRTQRAEPGAARTKTGRATTPERGTARQEKARGDAESGRIRFGISVTLATEQMTTDSKVEPAPKVKLTKSFGDPNRAKNLERLDQLASLFPNPLASPRAWYKFTKSLTGLSKSFALPTLLLSWGKPGKLEDYVAQVPNAQRKATLLGMQIADEIGQAYRAGEMTAVETGMLFHWSMMSRMASPAPQESAHLLARQQGLEEFIQKVVEGRWQGTGKLKKNQTRRQVPEEADSLAYERWLDSFYPKAPEGAPRAEWMNANRANMNAWLSWMVQVAAARYENMPLLAWVHQALEAGTDTKQIRRVFIAHAGSTGMGNKLVSFALLAAGRKDVVVIDRWQARNFWPKIKPFSFQAKVDGEMTDQTADVYDMLAATGLIDGPQGLAVYEGIERALHARAAEAYGSDSAVGELGGLSYLHWESWLVANDQYVMHTSLRAFLRKSVEYSGVVETRPTLLGFQEIIAFLPEGQRGYILEASDGTPRLFTPTEYTALPNPGRSKKARAEFEQARDTGGRAFSDAEAAELAELVDARPSALAGQDLRRGLADRPQDVASSSDRPMASTSASEGMVESPAGFISLNKESGPGSQEREEGIQYSATLRSDPGRWTNLTSSSVSSRTKKGFIVGSTDGPIPGKVVGQDTGDVAELTRRATEVLPRFEADLQDIASSRGDLQLRGARAKTQESIERKVRDKYARKGGGAEYLADIVAGRITYRADSSAEHAVATLESFGYRIIENEDFRHDDAEASRRGGYRAWHIIVLTPEGLAAELQIQSEEMNTAQNRGWRGSQPGHKLYEITRNSNTPQSERARVWEQMEEVYAQAYKWHLAQLTPNDRLRRGLAAWHGTAWFFDNFETEKINSGEGVQAYGWGLYFASRREIARWYREKVSAKARREALATFTEPPTPRFRAITINGVTYDHTTARSDNPQSEVALGLLASVAGEGLSTDAAIEDLRQATRLLGVTPYGGATPYAGWTTADRAEVLRFLDSLSPGNISFEPAGYLYGVELAPNEDEFLLWDRPLSEQSDKVQQALAPLLEELGFPALHAATPGRMIYYAIGEQLMRSRAAISAKFGPSLPSKPRRQNKRERDRGASLELLKHGVRGIRYYDAWSRALNLPEGERDYNYVVFSDRDVTITSRRGLGLPRGWRNPEAPKIDAPPPGDPGVYFQLLLAQSGTVNTDGRPWRVTENGPAGRMLIGAFESEPEAEEFVRAVKEHYKYAGQVFGSSRMRGARTFAVNEAAEPEDPPKRGFFQPRRGLAQAPNQPLTQRLSSDDYAPTGWRLHWSKLGRLLWDEALWVKKLVDYVREVGEGVNDMNDTYGWIARMPGRMRDRIDTLDRRYRKPIAKLLQDAGVSVQEFGDYLYAKHAVERNNFFVERQALHDADVEQLAALAQDIDALTQELGKMRRRKAVPPKEYAKLERQRARLKKQRAELKKKVDKYKSDFKGKRFDTEGNNASGMPNAEAEKLIARLGAKPAIQQAARRVYQMNRSALALRLEAGLITQELHDELSSRYQFYVPLEKDEPAAFSMGRGGARYGVAGQEWQRATGRTSKADNPYLHSWLNATSSIERAERNAVGQSLVRLLEEAKVPLAEGQQNPLAYSIEELKDLTAEQAQELRSKNTFTIKRDGKTFRVRIDPELERAMARLGVETIGKFLQRFIVPVTRLLSTTATSLNPDFILPNLFRDLQTAMVNIGAQDLEGIRSEIFRTTLRGKMHKALYRAGGGGEQDTSKMSEEDRVLLEYARELSAHGGMTGWYYQPSFEEIEREITREVSGDRARVLFGSVPVPHWMSRSLRKVEDLNIVVENGVRLAAFVAMRKRGVSAMQAAKVSKELTVNFNRKGEWGGHINALYMFFNAATGGLLQMGRAMTTPGQGGKNVRAALGSMVVLGVMQELWNRLLGGDDEETGQMWIDTIPDWEQDTHWIVKSPFPFLPDTKMPMPHTANLFVSFGRSLVRTAFYDKPVGKEVMRLALSAYESSNPLGSSPTVQQFGTPSVFKPFMDVGVNATFSGAPVYPEPYGYGPETTQAYQSYSGGGFLKGPTEWAAQALNAMTGGDRVKPGLVDFHPDSLEHVLQFYGGGTFRFAERFVKSGFGLVTGDIPSSQDIPIVRRFVAEAPRWMLQSDFYDAADEVELQSKRVKLYTERREMAYVRDLRRKHGRVMALADATKQAKTRLGELKDRLDATDDKRARSRIETQIERVLQQYLRRYYTAAGTY